MTLDSRRLPTTRVALWCLATHRTARQFLKRCMRCGTSVDHGNGDYDPVTRQDRVVAARPRSVIGRTRLCSRKLKLREGRSSRS
jgi:hypothetical protein